MRWYLLPFIIPSPLVAQVDGADELHLVKALFADLNPISIRENREYCGYIGYDQAGKLVASEPLKGDEDSCAPEIPDHFESVVASYHTHAGYLVDGASEIPSGEDMESDEAEGIDGWVATPGGRLWFIDTQDMVTSQICGVGCLPQDPKFRLGDLGRIRQSYSYDELVQKLDDLDAE